MLDIRNSENIPHTQCHVHVAFKERTSEEIRFDRDIQIKATPNTSLATSTNATLSWSTSQTSGRLHTRLPLPSADQSTCWEKIVFAPLSSIHGNSVQTNRVHTRKRKSDARNSASISHIATLRKHGHARQKTPIKKFRLSSLQPKPAKKKSLPESTLAVFGRTRLRHCRRHSRHREGRSDTCIH